MQPSAFAVFFVLPAHGKNCTFRANFDRMEELSERFAAFNQQQVLFGDTDSILLAVSGGIDSVAMLNLFLDTGHSSGVVHCNFRLRGNDSDEDEIFVRNLAALHNLPFFVRRFETRAYAQEKGISVQVAARELRYACFEEIRQKHGFSKIAIAHNSDDAIETFFINLLRGTGIRGLTGIKSRSGSIIRPLLFASRAMIEDYAKQTSMAFRIDKTNLDSKYTRNYIRHEIIPRLEKLNPGFRKTMLDTIGNLQGVASLLEDSVLDFQNQAISHNEDGIRIDLDRVMENQHGMSFLTETLLKYQFTPDGIRNVMHSLQGQPGKIFYSPTHRLVKDRKTLLLNVLDHGQPDKDQVYYIEHAGQSIHMPVNLELHSETWSPQYSFSPDPEVACLDAEKLSFPLMIRHWRHGDYFRPLGMENMMKVSDFFVNSRMSIPEKENTWLLVSEGRIAWIIGRRIDHRFRITESTRSILCIRLIR